ncbi:MAG TPA: tRNA glutamyl-Q(34) synthetase GluQRS [Thermoanaerobaculia bacterium]|nr:tRNA glutamyl-Q(34) synthetase GluQRS [Thermoanaerobaculia bacterium]
MTLRPASSSAGRFAPSPTGPLHLGSLVAAVGSWLFARVRDGSWLVRMEDLDTARVVPGAADEILRTLERFGLTWDGEVIYQSTRLEHYKSAFEDLLGRKEIYACACSRGDIARAASAPAPGDEGDAPSGGAVYPGTCRAGLPPGRTARAYRFRVLPGLFTFRDLVFGSFSEDVEKSVGDFVVQRADGPTAYQLAVVVDDAEQGVTEVVRGADLLSSTARQIALQRALGVPTPSYAHLPLVLGRDGAKLGKRDGALPLAREEGGRVRQALALALRILGQAPADGSPGEMLTEALRRFDPRAIPREPWRFSGF